MSAWAAAPSGSPFVVLGLTIPQRDSCCGACALLATLAREGVKARELPKPSPGRWAYRL